MIAQSPNTFINPPLTLSLAPPSIAPRTRSTPWAAAATSRRSATTPSRCDIVCYRVAIVSRGGRKIDR